MATPTTIYTVANSVTPYSIKLYLNGDGGAGPARFSFNSLILALSEGPLKRELQKVGSANLGTFNVDQARGNKIRIYDEPVSTAVLRNGAFLVSWVSDSDPNAAGLECFLRASNVRIIEIRYNHSVQA